MSEFNLVHCVNQATIIYAFLDQGTKNQKLHSNDLNPVVHLSYCISLDLPLEPTPEQTCRTDFCAQPCRKSPNASFASRAFRRHGCAERLSRWGVNIGTASWASKQGLVSHYKYRVIVFLCRNSIKTMGRIWIGCYDGVASNGAALDFLKMTRVPLDCSLEG